MLTLGNLIRSSSLSSSGSNTQPDNLPATPIPAAAPRSGGMASHPNLYNRRRLPDPPTISHQYRSHISAAEYREIVAIDEGIQAACSAPESARLIATKLTELLDKPYFQAPGNPANPDTSRGPAQKMALETFTKAFPFALSNDGNHLNLLRKLIDVLPNLEHHKIVERNAQRRGLRVLEKALGNLKPDEAAEVLAHLMNRVSDLSQKLSRHKVASVVFNEGTAEASAFLGCFSGFMGMFGAYGSAAAMAVTLAPMAGVPLVALAGGMAVVNTKIIRKQPQGTALYMLKDQLAKLRKDWGNVTPDNRQKLIEAFKNLQDGYDKLLGTKTSTLQRFFNDSFIDPSKFDVEPEQGREWRKQLHHQFIAPVASRLKSVPASTVKAIKHDVMQDSELKRTVLGVAENPSIGNKQQAINHLMNETRLKEKITGNPDFKKHVDRSAERDAAADKLLRTTIEFLVDESYRAVNS